MALENELSHLRPVLLMQPYALSSSHREHRKKKAETANVVAAEADATDATEGEPSTPKERKRQDSQGQYYRQREGDEREGHQRSRRSRKRSYFKRTPTLTDARAEHLLLAARRIGRRRATMLSSSTFQPPESEPAASSNTKGKGRANDGPSTPSATFTPGQALGPLPTTPKTPQKSPTRPPYPPGSPGFFPSAAHPFFVPAPPSGGGRPLGGRPGGMPAPFFVSGPVPGPAYAFYGTAPYPGFAPAGASPSHSSAKSPNVTSTAVSSSKSAGPSTPASRQRQQGKSVGGSGATAASPLTPLDKLLSAAQTVFSPSATPTGNGKRTSASAVGGPSDTTEDVSDGSPTPKRRRIGSTTNADTTEGPSARLGRRASALDVLADQAIGSGSADVNDSRSRSGSVSSIASAASKNGQVVPRGGASRGRGRGRASRARPTRKRKKAEEDLEEEEPIATVVPQGRAKSSSRKRGSGTGSRGSSLDPPISLSGRKSTSRSATPNSVSKRSQLRDIPEEDEDAPHEVDDEMQEVLTQSPRTDSAALVDRSSLKKKNVKNGIARTSEDDVGPESEEEQDGDEEVSISSNKISELPQRYILIGPFSHARKVLSPRKKMGQHIKPRNQTKCTSVGFKNLVCGDIYLCIISNKALGLTGDS